MAAKKDPLETESYWYVVAEFLESNYCALDIEEDETGTYTPFMNRVADYKKKLLPVKLLLMASSSKGLPICVLLKPVCRAAVAGRVG